MKETYRITFQDLCFAVESFGGRIIFAAPVAKWMHQKETAKVLKYWSERGAEVLKIS